MLRIVNSDSAWKVSKGRRSASRRARNIVRKGIKNCTSVICSSSEQTNMPVSESEKRGVSVLGCSFSDKAEHVPIKKRRFLLRTSSPPSPPRLDVSVSTTEEIADHSKIQDASNELAAKESALSDVNSGQITDSNISDQAKKSEKASENFGDDEDFSGISILAAAACSSSLGRECGYAEDRSCVEECSTQEQVREICASIKEPSSPRELLKDELVNSSEILTGGASSCVSTEPVGEILSLSTTENSLQKVETGGRCIKDATPWAGSLSLSRDVTCSKDEETVGNQSLSSRDDRLHWDLNVVMDAWEHSFEDSDAHNEHPHKTSDDNGKYSDDDKRESFEGLDSRDKLVTTLANQNSLPLGEPGKLTDETSEGYKEKICVGAHGNVSNPVVNQNSLPLGEPGKLTDETSEGYKEKICVGAHDNVSNPVSSDVDSQLNCNNDLHHMNYMVEDAKQVHHLESVNNTHKLVTPILDDGFQLSQSGTANKGEDLSAKNLKLFGDGKHFCRLALEVTSSFSGAPCELEKLRSDSPFDSASADIQTRFCVSSSPDIRGVITPYLAGLDNVETSQGLHDDVTACIEKVNLKTNEPVGHGDAFVSSENVLPCTSSAEAPDSASSKYEAQLTLAKVQDVNVSQDANLVHNCETASKSRESYPVINKETCDSLFGDSCKANMDNKLIFSDKLDTVEDHDHSDGGDFDCHPASVVGVSSASRVREDYDSQYEDGELRETNECAWDEYCVDSEAEHMVGKEDMEISPIHYHVSESEQVDVEKNVVMGVMATIPSSVNNIENEVSAKAAECEGDDGTHDVDNKIKSNHLSEDKMDAPRLEELPEISKSSSETATGVGGDYGRNDSMPSCDDGLVDSGGIETRMDSKGFRRGLRSQIEGPVAHDVLSRDERLDKVESRYEESSCMRSAERVRYPLHSQGKGRDHGGWNGSLDGRRGFKRRYSPIFHGQLKVDDDGIVEREDIRCVDPQNDAYAGLHSRCKPDRKFSPDRPSTFGRERSFRYGLSADSRAGRGRYTGPSKDEIFQSSLKYRRPLSHRERSVSPFGGRGQSNAYHSRGKSPSRSRSRSPFMWHSQRGRPGAGSGGNTFLRHRSRSPNFRSEVRVQRPRSPLHQPGFAGDHAMGFRSFPRNYSPPPRRWASARKDESGHFRDFGCKRNFALERSPGRNIKRGDRTGVTDSLRNIKPDGYYRISEDSAGREFRYEENYEDRRKHYGALCPTRRSYEDGMANRLHQDISDSFTGNSIRDRDASGFQGRGLRGIDCRIGDLPRLRGEHHSFMYEREGKFNSNSKQFGPDVMDSSSDLQSEEQYQSTRPGRFPVVDGPSRGRRYENYEDRRKPYGGVFRRSDMEGTEKRVNHFFDRNFQDAPFFSRRNVRNFDGQIGSLSTRLGEHQDSVGCRQEEKLEDNEQSFGGKNSDDHDTTKGRIGS